jgi:hypothetical protein
MQGGELIVVSSFGMKICGGAQLLRCSHLVVDHTSYLLIFKVNLIGQRFLKGD